MIELDLIIRIHLGLYTTYKARDKQSQEIVALKVMTPEPSVDLNKFKRRIHLIKKLKSPQIVNLKSIFYKDDNIWLSMEYCNVGSIQDIIKLVDNCKDNNYNYNYKNYNYYRFTEDEICIIMHETLKGLSYLHSKNIVHREIRGQNILLNMKGQCKLSNYDSMQPMVMGDEDEDEDKDENTSVIGSPYWIAPEIFEGTRWHTKADIWSLGITAIEMACGGPPHSDISPLRLMSLIPKEPAPRLPQKDDTCNWSDEFDDWLSKACDKNIQRRNNADELLKHKWFTRKNVDLSLNITLKLVEKVQPLIYRQREEERKKKYFDINNDYYDYNYNYDYQDGNGNDDNGDDDDEYDYGIMIGLDRFDERIDDENSDCSDYGDYGDYNSSNKDVQEKLQFQSVFKGNEYIDKCLQIPKDVTKEELMTIWNEVRNTSNKDKKIFEEFYKSILDQLDCMLANDN